MDDQFYWIWLSKISGIGPIKVQKLLEYFKTAQNIWQANQRELNNVLGIGPVLSKKIMKSKSKFSPSQEAEKLKKHQVKLVNLQNKCYPKLLKEIYDPPPVLYYRGSLVGFEAPSIAVVGTRNCTMYGKQVAYNLSRQLAQQGFSIISGLARGIDTRAHQGALQTGMTYAILGSGLDNIYPPENDKLAAKITQKGAVITAYPLGTEVERKNFPARNRIISGLSLGTLVVEAPKKSGALITAHLALEQNREVFAIPSDITKDRGSGSNKLIQAGAKLVQGVEDIIEELMLLNFLKDKVSNNSVKRKNKTVIEAKNDLSTTEKTVYQILTTEIQQFEIILAQVKMKSEQLASTLLQLEIAGLVEQLPGKRFRLLN